MKKYIMNLLSAVDQLGNTVAGGNPDVTVSGRVGYNSLITQKWYWKQLEKIIDFTFKPVDGKYHCNMTYLADDDLDLSTGSTLSLIALAIIACTTCLVLIPFIRILALF